MMGACLEASACARCTPNPAHPDMMGACLEASACVRCTPNPAHPSSFAIGKACLIIINVDPHKAGESQQRP